MEDFGYPKKKRKRKKETQSYVWFLSRWYTRMIPELNRVCPYEFQTITTPEAWGWSSSRMVGGPDLMSTIISSSSLIFLRPEVIHSDPNLFRWLHPTEVFLAIPYWSFYDIAHGSLYVLVLTDATRWVCHSGWFKLLLFQLNKALIPLVTNPSLSCRYWPKSLWNGMRWI